MASTRPTQSINTLTPPSSSHGGRGSWEFAVPIDNENTNPTDKKSYVQSDVSSRPYAYTTRQPLSQHNINGAIKASQRTNTLDSQRSSRSSSGVDSHEPSLLAPARILSRKHSGALSNGSDPDSGLDMYKTNPNARNTTHGPQNGNKRGPTSAPRRPSMDVDDSAWIHRDKLAEIESRELEEAGFRVGRSSRSGTRSSRSTSRHRSDQSAVDRYGETGSVDDYGQSYAARDEKRQRRVSPIPAEEEYEEVYDEPESMNWDSGNPEEAAAHQQQNSQGKQHALRPSTSRIPISKSSPVPVPKPVKDRENPLPRSRNGSGAWGSAESGLPQPKTRSRSASVSSAVLLDEYDSDPPRTPVRVSTSDDKNRSPQKGKTPGKGAPSGKKTGTKPRQVSTARSRQASGTTASVSPTKQRPGTSGGGIPRPSTARPEGEPPWIATMYKPDPRLPPDQQMLPTHAKRMMQEQWEREGKTGSMYDREFRLLNAEEFAEPKRSEDRLSTERGKRSEDRDAQWPLPSPKSMTSNGRPGTSGTDHGGYKITPTIHSPKSPNMPKAEGSRRQVEPVRVQEPPRRDETEKEKKMCCGCAVM